MFVLISKFLASYRLEGFYDGLRMKGDFSGRSGSTGSRCGDDSSLPAIQVHTIHKALNT